MSKNKPRLILLGSFCCVLLGVVIVAATGCLRTQDTAADAAPTAAVEPEVHEVEGKKRPKSDTFNNAPQPISLGKAVCDGISIQFSLTRLAETDSSKSGFLEGDDVSFQFRLTDATGTPLTSVYPAAWLVKRQPGTVTSPELANRKAEALINASIFSPADLDLNIYYVLALNGDATVTVVDPQFGYGGTKLLAIIPLKSTGADWVLTEDGKTLFISLPESHEVSVIDTTRWEVLKNVPGGLLPERLALQPDGHYLWVGGGGYGERAEDSGVTVLSTKTLDVVARIRTGRGRHDITFSDDSRFAFVTNSQQGTVSIIDVRSLKKRADVATGVEPVSIDYSTTGQVAYVSHSAGDGIVAVSASLAKVVAREPAERGLGQIRFGPDGRHGFVANTEKDLVHVLDAATGRIVQTADIKDGPDQFAFSDNLAYVRRRGSATVAMIPLDEVGNPGGPLPVIEFPGGQEPTGRMSRPCFSDSMVQAPGASAMLVANPADQAIYFYKEGMAAPMGTFNNYSREPLAVAVVDRSLRERSAAGVYETVARLREPDSYDVVFFLDAPRIVHCFPLEVQADPELQKERNKGKVDITHAVDQPELQVGKSTQIRFRITDRNDGTPRSKLDDVVIQTFLVPNRHERFFATEMEPGVYAIDFTPPQTGVYYISVASASIGLTHDNPALLIMRAAVESLDETESAVGAESTDK